MSCKPCADCYSCSPTAGSWLGLLIRRQMPWVEVRLRTDPISGRSCAFNSCRRTQSASCRSRRRSRHERLRLARIRQSGQGEATSSDRASPGLPEGDRTASGTDRQWQRSRLFSRRNASLMGAHRHWIPKQNHVLTEFQLYGYAVHHVKRNPSRLVDILRRGPRLTIAET
jgi:hypothetical protein